MLILARPPAAYEAQQMERAHMQEFVDKFYNEKRSSAQSSRVRLAMSRQKALDKMELIEDPRKEIVRAQRAIGQRLGRRRWLA